MNVQIAILEVKRHVQSFALNCGEQSGIDVEIDRIAKLVTFAGRRCFYAGREIDCVMATSSALAKTSEQVSQRFITQKVETLFRDFEADVTRKRIGNFAVSTLALLLVCLLLFLVKR